MPDVHTKAVMVCQIEELFTIRYGRETDEPVPVTLLKAAARSVIFNYPESLSKYKALIGMLEVVGNLRKAEETAQNGTTTNSRGDNQHP